MNKQELREIIAEEKAMYNKSNYAFQKFTHQKRYTIWRYLCWFRWTQYYREQLTAASGLSKLFAKIAYRFAVRRKNICGEKCDVEITNNSQLGRRLNIWHGSVVISGHLGDDCIIHGNNIIGNKGDRSEKTPVLGDRVDVGAGAVVIGGIHVADDCRIGANAVVNKDFTEAGSLIVGIPARKLK